MSGGSAVSGLTAKERLWIDDFDPIYMTNGYTDGGVAGIDTDVGGTEVFTNDIDLTKDLGASFDFDFTPSDDVDDVILTLYARNDDQWTGFELDWKNAPITVSNPGTRFIYHYRLTKEQGAGHVRWGMKRSGSSTTFDVKVSHVQTRTWDVRRPDQTE